jgi:hypothetical protein
MAGLRCSTSILVSWRIFARQCGPVIPYRSNIKSKPALFSKARAGRGMVVGLPGEEARLLLFRQLRVDREAPSAADKHEQ